jgi:outer membrane protein assembly factor BamE (lipoprotein component of BamABCDE complex)
MIEHALAQILDKILKDPSPLAQRCGTPIHTTNRSIRVKNTPRKIALMTVVLAVPLTMSGCLIASSKHSNISGAYVQPGSVSKVKINHSTTTDVEEILGQPSIKSANDDGSETWDWNWTESKGDSGAVFLVFGGSSNKTITESVHIKFADGVAVKKWRD